MGEWQWGWRWGSEGWGRGSEGWGRGSEGWGRGSKVVGLWLHWRQYVAHFLMCMVRYRCMALSGTNAHTIHARICQAQITLRSSTSASLTPAVCFIS